MLWLNKDGKEERNTLNVAYMVHQQNPKIKSLQQRSIQKLQKEIVNQEWYPYWKIGDMLPTLIP